MKITPMAPGHQSMPGTDLAGVSMGGDPSAERRDPTSLRRFKFKTNFSQNRPAPAEGIGSSHAGSQVVENPASADQTGQSAISDNQQEPPASRPLSPQFAALAKQRRALQQERQAFEAEKAKLTAADQGGSRIDVARIKAEPLKVLAEAGVSYEDLTNHILGNPVNTEVEALKAEIKSLRDGIDKNFTDRDAQAEQQALRQMRFDAEQMVNSSTDYEMVKAAGKVPTAIELIHRTYKKTGEVMDVAEALSLVEQDLIDQTLKYAALPKIQTRLTPRQEAAAAAAAQTQQQQTTGQAYGQNQRQQQTMRTITNRDGARPLLDRRARAIAAAMGNR